MKNKIIKACGLLTLIITSITSCDNTTTDDNNSSNTTSYLDTSVTNTTSGVTNTTSDGGDEVINRDYTDIPPVNVTIRFHNESNSYDNLRYWFRGVEKFAPWVNNIYFVTWGHIPSWLNINHPNLNIVKHEDFIPKQYLPTFNSHTIELNFHRIKGLSEKFVYFNDDMYLINKSNPEDFFRNNLPCDAAVLGCICPQDDVVSNVIFNNVVILNKYFVKTDLTIKKWNYVLNLKYGKHLIRTLLLYPFGKFTGFYDFHLAIPFMKKTFEEVWQLEKKVLDTTCNNKFRTVHDVSPWIFRYWQLAKCDFVPHKVLGKYFAIGDRHSIDYILKQKNTALIM